MVETSPVSRMLGQYTLQSIVEAAFDAIIAITMMAMFVTGLSAKQEARNATADIIKNIKAETCIFLPSFS